MPNRESQKYTRYINDTDGDDDDEERQQPPNGEVEQELEEYDENQMQEGRRVLAMMTPKTPQTSPYFTRTEYLRILFVVVLSTAICFTGGALFGHYVGNNSSVRTILVNQSCQSLLNYSATTTTSTTTTTTLSPKFLSTTVPPEFEEPDIPRIAGHFLSHMTPELLKIFVSNISTLQGEHIRSFVHHTLETHGFEVQEKAFPVMSSIADKNNPNTVEIVTKSKNILINNVTESLKDFHPFAGFSPNGTVAGPLVYAHYGSEEDFQVLGNNSVTVNGSIVLIRLCEVHPGVQIRHAEARGAKGVILYPDPKDFGDGEKNPRNDSLPLDGVVWQNLRMIPGDPSTPFYASQRDVYRSSPEKYVDAISIVVQPVSSNSGLELLRVLGGSEVPEGWKGRLDVSYRFGGSFNNDQISEVKIVSNNQLVENHQHTLFAYLPARDHSKVIQIGCHYDIKDSRITSSGIGLAGLLALGIGLRNTYPNGTDRLIVLSAFEGKDGDFSVGNEYSQLYSWWIESTSLAYVDMDEILQGKGFVRANVSPILTKLVKEALSHVSWIGQEGLTAYQGLTEVQSRQASFAFTSPYECDESVNFLNVHGIPSLQLTAVSLNKSSDFHLRNSQYDNMKLIQRFEDTDLHWSHMIVSTMGISVLLLACTPLPPILFEEVAWDLSIAWKTFLKEEIKNLSLSEHPSINELTERITAEMGQFVLTCGSYDTWYTDGKIKADLTQMQIFRNLESRLVKFQQFGRRFLRPRNVPRHSSFGSYLIFGPSPDNTCEGTYFPFIKKALKEALSGKSSWDILHEELSLLLSSLMDLKTD